MKTKRGLTAVAGACIAVGVFMPGMAQAATGSYLNVPFSDQYSHLPQTIVAGDCRETGQNQEPDLAHATIRLLPPNSAGTTDWVWSSTLYTVHSNSYDVWHAKFVFKNAAGNPVLTVKSDGPKRVVGWVRKKLGQPFYYSPTTPGSVQLTAAQYNSITSVDWYGDC
jgi:hypothetical protein